MASVKGEQTTSKKSGSKQNVRLSDIAEACGVSPATVSLTLNGSTLVNKNTKQRVELELERQGYVYNRAAANLRKQQSNAIALVIHDLGNPFFAEFAVGVDETLAKAGYVTLLGSTQESLSRQDEVLRTFREMHPAGIILSPAENSSGDHLMKQLGRQLPVLVFNRHLASEQWDFLVCDNVLGAKLATEHLIKLGHSRIAFFGGHKNSSSCAERVQGFREAMTQHHIAISDKNIFECSPNRRDAISSGHNFFKSTLNFSAAVCYNDVVALGLMSAAHSNQKTVGENFSIVGFDNIPESEVVFPSLTTISIEPRALGRQAADMLLMRIKDVHSIKQKITIPVTLIERESTCVNS